MKVYVVTAYAEWGEEHWTVGVFSTEEKAAARVEAVEADFRRQGWSIHRAGVSWIGGDLDGEMDPEE